MNNPKGANQIQEFIWPICLRKGGYLSGVPALGKNKKYGGGTWQDAPAYRCPSIPYLKLKSGRTVDWAAQFYGTPTIYNNDTGPAGFSMNMPSLNNLRGVKHGRSSFTTPLVSNGSSTSKRLWFTESGYNDTTVKEIHQRCMIYALGNDLSGLTSPGKIPYPVHGGRSNVAAHDGHVESVSMESLNDMHHIRNSTINGVQQVHSVYVRVARDPEDPNLIVEL